MHAAFFATPTLAVEPQFGLLRLSGNGSSTGLLTAGLQVNQFFGEPSVGAPFVFAVGTVNAPFGDGNDDSTCAVGGGIGYRWIVAETLGLRVEGVYRRHFRDFVDLNEFSLLIGLGTVLGGR